MKKKVKNFSSRILLIVLVSFILTNSYFIYNIYDSKISGSEKSTLNKLESISKTISSQIDGTIVKMLLERYPEKDDVLSKFVDPYYRDICETLEKTAELNNILTDIYTLTWDSLNQNFFFGMTSGENQYFRHIYENPPPVLVENYEIGGVVPTYDDEHGTWLSSFSPIKDHKGRVVAVVQVDMPFDAFILEARMNLYTNILYSLLLIAIISILMFYWLRILLRREEKMMMQLESTNLIVEKKNEDITASISYAKRIQQSLMDSEEKLLSLFPESFVLYKPKDIVSGDFYWINCFNEKDSKIAVAVADCTGHGVPGALVSVLGITFLRDIVNNNKEIKPNEILSELNQRIITTFKQKDQGLSAKDGMDISICIIDKESRRISFSGAYRPLIHIRGKEITEISGDKKPIGGDHFTENREFTNHEISYMSGDFIYMLSDGYIDQFGGERKRKYMKKRLKEKLCEIIEEPLDRQLEILKTELRNWMGNIEQIDDITVMGIRLE